MYVCASGEVLVDGVVLEYVANVCVTSAERLSLSQRYVVV